MNHAIDRYPELLKVPMSDGGVMAVHRYARGDAAVPAVLLITPYRKESKLWKESWDMADRGYNFFVADVRGFGDSKGPYTGILSDREIQDGVELIQWLARQPFCNGKVATVGGSYTGANQMLIAARRPKGLVCIAPTVGPVDFYRDWNWRGGIATFVGWGMTYFRSGQAETLRQGLRLYYTDLMPNPFDRDAMRLRSAEYVLPKIEVPAMLTGGWDDYFLRGTVRAYLRIPAPRRLVVGPWGHGTVANTDETCRWLDYWLKGQGVNPAGNPRVRLFRTGSQDWIERDEWFDYRRANWRSWHPFSSAAETYVPSNFGGIELPKNIRTPLPPESGFGHWPELSTADSEPFDRETDIDGQPALEAFVDAGSCGDYEFHARLSVVRPDGACVQLTEGRLLASHRQIDESLSFMNSQGYPIVPWHTHQCAEKCAGGGYTRLNVEINPLCHRFFPGERLRLGVSILRADEEAAPTTARIGPQTRVLLPLTTGVGS